jgi:hypothetical protein
MILLKVKAKKRIPLEELLQYILKSPDSSEKPRCKKAIFLERKEEDRRELLA